MSDIARLLLDLRAEVAALTLRVQALEEQLGPRRRADRAFASVGRRARPTSATLLAGPSALPAHQDRGSGQVDPSGTEGRVCLARELGAFLRASFQGTNRGASGRDRLRLQSRLRRFQRHRLGPIRVCPTFASCKALASRRICFHWLPDQEPCWRQTFVPGRRSGRIFGTQEARGCSRPGLGQGAFGRPISQAKNAARRRISMARMEVVQGPSTGRSKAALYLRLCRLLRKIQARSATPS